MRRYVLAALLLFSCSGALPVSGTDAGPRNSTAGDAGADGGSLPDGGSVGDGGSGSDGGSLADGEATLIAQRPYPLHVPAGYDPHQPTPLVIMLHGYGANAAGEEAYFKLTPVSDAQTFLYAMPNGTVDAAGHRFWNATDTCCDFFHTGVDDVAYVNAIIDDVQARFNLDPKRVYVVGHSNGAFLAQRLACDLSTRIAAIVSLAGAQWKDQRHCRPTEPVAALEVHGTADSVVLYGGGTDLDGLTVPAYPGAEETVADWATHDGCAAALADTGTRLDLDSTLDGDETEVWEHANCPPGGAAELWKIDGGAHIPTLTSQWGELIWRFFAAHPKP